MGLLDDAIREHLELKRRSGADPAVVEREEHEALAPVYDEDAPLGDDEAGLAHVSDEVAAEVAAHPEFVPIEDQPDVDPRLADLGGVGQETAELDMRAVLEEDAYMAAGSAAPVGPVGAVGGAVVPSHGEELPQEEPFEWEQPDASENGSVPEEIPGQERLSFE
jgi:hypothetical protein